MLPQRESGFTLLGLLFLMMVLGIALAAVGTVWETAARREKEAELLFVGDQYRRALESYYRATPGQAKRYPASLSDLVKDNRFPNAVRHLRRLYRDPMTQGEQWGEVKEGNEIVGVYSLSMGIPLKQGGLQRITRSSRKSRVIWNGSSWPGRIRLRGKFRTRLRDRGSNAS